MRITLCQINTTVGDIRGNVGRMLTEIDALRSETDVIIFPELAVCGYPPTDHVFREDFRDLCQEANERLVEASETDDDGQDIWIIFGTMLPSEDGTTARMSNGGIVAHKGKEVGFVRKTHLPTYDIYDELRFFAPGIGPACVVDMGSVQLGIAICEDFWRVESNEEFRNYPRDLGKELASQGATHLLNLSASPWHRGKVKERYDVVGRVGRDNSLPLIYANMVGGNDALIFDGRSLAWNKKGEEVTRAAAYEEDRISFELSSDDLVSGSIPAQITAQDDSDEDVVHALALGVRDFLRKSGVQSVILGLSGGVDSAVTACIATLALGPDKVTGVAMPSQFSSNESFEDAEQMARALGIEFLTLPIQEGVDALSSTLVKELGREMRGLANENLQARVRGNLLMALANDQQAMVLNTGNKSELAAGYCTLYGDMAGGLAVIGDLTKHEVYAIGRAVSRVLGNAIPERVFTKEPTAELRPGQLDSDSLPPYPDLDAFVEGYIVANQDPGKVASGEMSGPQWAAQVERQQFKRAQAPPVLRVSAKAFGMGRRMAIAKHFSR